MTFFEQYLRQEIASGLVIVITIFLRIIVTKTVKRYSSSYAGIEKRTNLVIKYIHLLISILAVISFIVIWGVQTSDIFVTLSSIATIVGVAMFAQWSILSNVTSGVILFFSFPFKIGDIIKVHDKDFPIEGEILNINAFHIDLVSVSGERMVYPNNLLLQKGISIIQPNYADKEFTD
jgi:small-conductance mechanosensitive channel